jgi:hypothetical protein
MEGMPLDVARDASSVVCFMVARGCESSSNADRMSSEGPRDSSLASSGYAAMTRKILYFPFVKQSSAVLIAASISATSLALVSPVYENVSVDMYVIEQRRIYQFSVKVTWYKRSNGFRYNIRREGVDIPFEVALCLYKQE